jgi:hypothetical protein
MEVCFPPLEERFHVWISLTEFIKLAMIMRVSKMVPAIANQSVIGSVCADIADPSGTKSRIAIRASELTSTVKTDFKSAEIDIR